MWWPETIQRVRRLAFGLSSVKSRSLAGILRDRPVGADGLPTIRDLKVSVYVVHVSAAELGAAECHSIGISQADGRYLTFGHGLGCTPFCTV